VAIKNTQLSPSGDSSGKHASSALNFHEKASELFKGAGGTIIGTDGDLVIACFGSPLERVFLEDKKKGSPYKNNVDVLATPAQRAIGSISEIIHRPECSPWNFGLDIGKCTFAWTAVSGYYALGKPIQLARILSRLGSRFRTRIVLSAQVNEALPDLVSRKLSSLKGKDGAAAETFYRLEL